MVKSDTTGIFPQKVHAYSIVREKTIVAFYIDPLDKGYVAGCIYENNMPSIYVSNGEDDEKPAMCTVQFPEFVGWKVHSV